MTTDLNDFFSNINTSHTLKCFIESFISEYELPMEIDFFQEFYHAEPSMIANSILSGIFLVGMPIKQILDIDEINEAINIIKKNNNYEEYIESKLIIHDTLGKNSLGYFWNFIDTLGTKEEFTDNLEKGQRKALNIAIKDIKEKFTIFLKKQIEKSGKKTISIKVNYILDNETDKLETKILEVNEIDYIEWKEIGEDAISDELVEIITNETGFCVSELGYELV